MTTTVVRDSAAPSEAVALRRRRRIALAITLAVVLVAASVWAVFFSPLIGVRSIAVRGEHVVTKQQVLAAADIARGTPLVRLDTGAVARRVEHLPAVASATVDTSFPSTVVITVVERVPVGYVHAGGARYLLVDRTGAQYRTLPSAPPKLPQFVVPTGPSGRATGAGVAEVAAALPAALLQRLASIQALDPSEITLVLRGGRVVRWGSAARNADKARVLAALLLRRNAQIDVSNPDQPFTR